MRRYLPALLATVFAADYFGLAVIAGWRHDAISLAITAAIYGLGFLPLVFICCLLALGQRRP